jgi:hypothetical protein
MSATPPAKPPPIPRDYYGLIPDPAGRQLLLLPGPDGWHLPHFRSEEPNLFQGMHIRAAMQAALGIEVSLLRCAEMYANPEDRRWRWAVLELENQSPGWEPPDGAQWVDRAALAGLPLAQPEQRATIEGWLAERESGNIPALRPAWARPGWLAEVTAWVAAHLAERGATLDGPLEQRKTWSISCLLRGSTAAGAVYVKACPNLPLFTHEPAITAALAAHYPQYVPQPLAVEQARRWMLLADFGNDLLDNAPLPAWEAMIDTFARMQRESEGQIAALLAAGCLDRRPATLVAAIPALLADSRALHIIPAEELDQLEAAAPRLAALCDALTQTPVAPTLVHGDLHGHNVALRDGVPIFFDWSDACIAHPFFDLATLPDGDFFTANPDELPRLRDRYLAHWSDVAPHEELVALADQVVPVALLHHSVSYQHIVISLEPSSQSELSNGWRYFLRELLKALG